MRGNASLVRRIALEAMILDMMIHKLDYVIGDEVVKRGEKFKQEDF